MIAIGLHVLAIITSIFGFALGILYSFGIAYYILVVRLLEKTIKEIKELE
ncbi:hypothetical protein [Brachyspira innocens]|nr:hypothetical protein [Brachyspira innocens]